MPIKDIEARRAFARAYYHANHEKQTAYFRAYYHANKEHVSQQRKAEREANPARKKAWSNASYARNKAKKLARQRIYRKNNATKIAARNDVWRLAHLDQIHSYEKKYRANRRGAPFNDLTHAQWLEIQEVQDHRCYYCGKRCKGKLTQDHIIPLSKGGAHTLHNVIGACRSCNSKKNAGPPLTPVQPLLLTIAPKKKESS
jgi:5-methylcytosine-specific restriction endonuclease McrA